MALWQGVRFVALHEAGEEQAVVFLVLDELVASEGVNDLNGIFVPDFVMDRTREMKPVPPREDIRSEMHNKGQAARLHSRLS